MFAKVNLKYTTNHCIIRGGEAILHNYLRVLPVSLSLSSPLIIVFPYGVMVSTIGFGPVSFGSNPDKETKVLQFMNISMYNGLKNSNYEKYMSEVLFGLVE